jgi:hypothetical protein
MQTGEGKRVASSVAYLDDVRGAIIAAMADETPDAAAWLDYERPIDAVRALFFDVDLAVRDKIHRGVRLQWLPRTPDGERRLRRHTRVLDKLHAEEVVIEEGPDHAWVQRFVEGPSAGTRFVGRFESIDGGGTRVRVEAHVGPKGFAQGLGKLSPLGLEKALKRVLSEYKLALQGYEPGRARGAVTAALADATRWAPALRALEDGERKRVVGALLETAWSVACADDGPDEAERDAMRAIILRLWNTTVAPDALGPRVRKVGGRARRAGGRGEPGARSVRAPRASRARPCRRRRRR